MAEKLDVRHAFLNQLSKIDGGVAESPEDLRNAQFGMPLRHYAQQYLYGATGLRFGTMYSISGPPQSCKSPFVFDLMMDCCESKEQGGSEGLAFLYDLEGKLSQSLVNSMAAWHNIVVGEGSAFNTIRNYDLGQATEHIVLSLLKLLKKTPTEQLIPLFLDLDSIGGAASSEVVEKMEKEGSVGKGFYDKAHNIKYFCESWSKLAPTLPVILMVVNQEKQSVNTMPGFSGPAPKHITGGESQIYKAGHMISASYRNITGGIGKIVTLKTTKTSFCDPRKVEVNFVWNKFGSLDGSLSQGHHWQWAKAGVQLLANPEVVGDLRDIVDVKISGNGSVSCEQLGVKNVSDEDFEKALFDSGNSKVLDQLYAYYKIEKLGNTEDMIQYLLTHSDLKKKALEEQKELAKQLKEEKKAEAAAEIEAKRAKKEARLTKAAAKAADKPVDKPVDKVSPMEEQERIAKGGLRGKS